jgi:WD40 repeat protein
MAINTNEFIIRLAVSSFKYYELVAFIFKIRNKFLQSACLSINTYRVRKDYINTPHRLSKEIIYLNNGKIAILGIFECDLLIWDTKLNSIVKTIPHPTSVWGIYKLNNGNLLSYDMTNKAYIWSSSDFSLVKELTKHQKFIEDVKELHNGHLITASADKTMKIWNDEYKHINTLFGHTFRVHNILLLKESLFFSVSYDGTIRLWRYDNHNNYYCVVVLKYMAQPPSKQDVILLDVNTLFGYSPGFTKLWRFRKDYREYHCIDLPRLTVCVALSDETFATAYGNKIFIKERNSFFLNNQILNKHKADIEILKRNGNKLFSGDISGVIRIWLQCGNIYKCIKMIEDTSVSELTPIIFTQIDDNGNIIIKSNYQMIVWRF